MSFHYCGDNFGHIVSGNAFSTGIILADVSDPTKLWDLRCGNISTATTRVVNALNLTGNIPVIGDDPPAVASGALGKVDLTAQTADIGSTNLSNTPPAGFYEIQAILEDTTADALAGIVTVTFAWTDDVGATTDASLTLALTGTGRARVTIPIYVASGNISYSTAHTGIFGSAAYAIRIRVLALG